MSGQAGDGIDGDKGAKIPYDYPPTSTSYNPEDPTKEDDENEHKNAQVANVILSALSGSEFNRVDGIESAKVIWDTLRNLHEGTDSVRESKVEILKGQFERFVMLDGESPSDMYDRLSKIVNEIKGLGSKDMTDEVVVKDESKDVIQYINQSSTASIKKEDLALKAKEEEEENRKSKSMAEIDGEEMALFVKKFGKFMRRSGFFKGGSSKHYSNKSSGRHSARVCYVCKETGHFIADCPHLKDGSHIKEDKKKGEKKDEKKEKHKHSKREYYGQAHLGMIFGSDSESSSSEEEGVATFAVKPSSPPRLFDYSSDEDAPICLMAKEPKVPSPLKSFNVDLVSDEEDELEDDVMDDELFKSITKESLPHLSELLGRIENQYATLERQEALLIREKERSHELKMLCKSKMRSLWDSFTMAYLSAIWVEYVSGGRSWVIDSGCTNHMTGEESMFSTLDPNGTSQDNIVFGDDGKGKVVGLGKIAISNDLSIANVLLVKSLNYNILSVSQLCSMGYNCLFTDVDVIVYRRNDSSVVFKGVLKGKLYLVDFFSSKAKHETCLVAKSNTGWLWHRRLAHVGMRHLHKLLKHDHILGLTNVQFEKDRVCSACQASKQIGAHHPVKNVMTTTRPLELLHMDLFGPIAYLSIGGNKYGLVIVDDFSRFMSVSFLHDKSETQAIFKKFARRAQNEFDLKITNIRIDNGKEFKNT
uniref:Retrotransposon protein, putative, Ty1-copia subclass, expressed n=1 Tax=Oryza sativa subsp. japonica TaxID=39947 RepID=Q10PB8_ORYSJ|nr:retrotransposon protein, putative, Ty1-copia subclass, expressed [Oryza sativa Japonica Group]